MLEQLRTVPWYDRNVLDQSQSYAVGTIGPHAADRFTYTVPNGRKAFVESVFIIVMRITAPTTSRAVQGIIKLTPKDKSEMQLFQAFINDANVGAYDKLVVGFTGTLTEGDKITGSTSDASEDGTCGYILTVKIVEFDAFPIEMPPFQPELPKEDIQEPEKPWWEFW